MAFAKGGGRSPAAAWGASTAAAGGAKNTKMIKPKSKKGKRILEARAPKLVSV
jgi:hypothetical protein